MVSSAAPGPTVLPGARPRFAILASGRGSNAQVLMDSFASGFLPAELAVVICDRPGAAVLDEAAARHHHIALLPSLNRTREVHETELLACLQHHRVEHLLLAGYRRLLSPDFLHKFPGIVLNIHPSLLPDFPGLGAVARQWQAGVRVAGATVHYVDEGIDTGPTLLSGSLEVRGDEGADGLAERILREVEHVIYRRAVWLLCERLRNAPSAALSTFRTQSRCLS